MSMLIMLLSITSKLAVRKMITVLVKHLDLKAWDIACLTFWIWEILLRLTNGALVVAGKHYHSRTWCCQCASLHFGIYSSQADASYQHMGWCCCRGHPPSHGVSYNLHLHVYLYQTPFLWMRDTKSIVFNIGFNEKAFCGCSLCPASEVL